MPNKDPWEQNYAPTKSLFGDGNMSGPESQIPIYTAEADSPVNTLRALGGGATLNFWDEIEARARQGINMVSGGETDYETLRDDIRRQMDAYAQQNPGESITMEMVGAIAPTVAMLFANPKAGFPKVAEMGSRIGNFLSRGGQGLVKSGELAREATKLGGVFKTALPSAAVGVTEGAIGGYGASENPFLESGADIGIGAGIGGIASPALSVGGRFLSFLGNNFMDTAAQVLGVEGRDVASRKIQELAKSINADPSVVIQKIMRGEMMAESDAMNAVVKALKSRGGSAGRILEQNLNISGGQKSSRILDTEKVAQERLQKALIPEGQLDNNLVDYYDVNDATARKFEFEQYGDVFDVPTPVSNEVFSSASKILNSNRTVRKQIEDIYLSRPEAQRFFRVDKNGKMMTDKSGRIILTRKPTIEDAENIKIALDSVIEGIDASPGGNAKVGFNLKEMRDGLVNQLNIDAPNLATARANAATLRQSREAYKRAQSDLSKQNQEEVQSYVNKLLKLAEEGSPDQLNAYRLGMATSIKNKFLGREDVATELGRFGTKGNALLTRIVPEGKLDEVLDALEVSGQSRRNITKMSVGSDTQEKLLADSMLMRTLPSQAIYGALRGDFSMVIPSVIGMLQRGLSDEQTAQIARVLTADEKNLSLVKKALMDDTALNQLQNVINGIARTAGLGVRREVNTSATNSPAYNGGLLSVGP